MKEIITTPSARRIYENIKELPIIDYHCHLSPREIYEDTVFESLSQLWLAGDHYKWRLMRFNGVDEEYITGKASPEEKLKKFIETVSTAYGNPIKDWAEAELKLVFGINEELTPKNTEKIRALTATIIKEKQLSPRKMFEMFNVEYVATTDEVCDSLEYHALLRADKTLKTVVAPSFRVDKLVVFDKAYPEYIAKLSSVSGIKIDSLNTYKAAISARLDFFVENGCKFSDVGIEGFPNAIADENEASVLFERLINEGSLPASDTEKLQGYMFVFLGEEYAKRNMIMQLHLGAKRNSNSELLATCGRDAGADCVGGTISINSITNVLDRMNSDGLLPKSIIYTLNPNMYYELITMCGAFRGTVIGVPWWFCDHRKGIFSLLEDYSALGHIGSLFGMLTDSRSFLSYVRHDYFRQILSEYLSGFGDDEAIIETAKKLSYFNAERALKQ